MCSSGMRSCFLVHQAPRPASSSDAGHAATRREQGRQGRRPPCRLNLLSQVVGGVVDDLAIHHAPPVLAACTHPSLWRKQGWQEAAGTRHAACRMRQHPALPCTRVQLWHAHARNTKADRVEKPAHGHEHAGFRFQCLRPPGEAPGLGREAEEARAGRGTRRLTAVRKAR